MIGEIVRIIVPLIPRLIPIAKKVEPNVQVEETDTHIIFYLTKKNPERTEIYSTLQQLVPEAVTLYREDGTPFLDIRAEKEDVERVLGEVEHGGEKEPEQA